MWRETGGGVGDREKGVGGVREAGEEGAGGGIPKVVGSRRKRGKLQHLGNILQSEKCEEVEPTNTGREHTG